YRNEGASASPVRGILEAQFLLQPRHIAIDLPARGTVNCRCTREDPSKLIARKRQLTPCPQLVRDGNVVLPLHVVVSMDSNFEPLAVDGAHDSFVSPANVRSRQQRAVEECFQAVVLQD